MRSKQVRKRESPTQQVVNSTQLHGEKVASLLCVLYSGMLQAGEVMPDWHLVLTLIARGMTERLRSLTEADDANYSQNDNSLRNQRKAMIALAYDKIVRLRGLIEQVFGLEATVALGFSGKTPTDAEELLDLCGFLLSNLVALQNFKPYLEGFVASTDTISAVLQEPIELLRAAVAADQIKNLKAEATLKDKKRALKTYDEAAGAAAESLRGLFRLAGESELSKQLRHTVRQRKCRTKTKAQAASPLSTTPTAPAAQTDPVESTAPTTPATTDQSA